MIRICSPFITYPGDVFKCCSFWFKVFDVIQPNESQVIVCFIIGTTGTICQRKAFAVTKNERLEIIKRREWHATVSVQTYLDKAMMREHDEHLAEWGSTCCLLSLLRESFRRVPRRLLLLGDSI